MPLLQDELLAWSRAQGYCNKSSAHSYTSSFFCLLLLDMSFTNDIYLHHTLLHYNWIDREGGKTSYNIIIIDLIMYVQVMDF